MKMMITFSEVEKRFILNENNHAFKVMQAKNIDCCSDIVKLELDSLYSIIKSTACFSIFLVEEIFPVNKYLS